MLVQASSHHQYLLLLATKVEAPAVFAVHPVAVSSAPIATTYNEQHQIINDIQQG